MRTQTRFRCYQYLPHQRFNTSPTSATSNGTNSLGGSIVNSLNLNSSPSNPSTPRLLVSSNDEVIEVFDVVGQVPDSEREQTNSRRDRGRRNWSGGSVVDQTHDSESDSGSVFDSEEEPEELSSLDLVGGPCQLIARPELDIENLSTPINHSSLSPDGTKLVAVGDTDQVFLFDVRGDDYKLRQVIEGEENGRKDASFSTDWEKSTGNCFVVGSQGQQYSLFLLSLDSSPQTDQESTPRFFRWIRNDL